MNEPMHIMEDDGRREELITDTVIRLQQTIEQRAKEIEELKSKLRVAIDVYKNIEAQDASRIKDFQTQATLWKSEAHKISIAYDMAEKEIESLRAELEQYKIDCNELCIERENFIEELAALKSQMGEPSNYLGHITDEELLHEIDIRFGSEPVAWTNKDLSYFEKSTKSTVYGSHTIPLYLAAPAQKDGYVLVPIEPTNEMMEAALNEFHRLGYVKSMEFDLFYKAMINAAPSEGDKHE